MKDLCIRMLPVRWHLPLRYWYRRMLGRIEPELRLARRLVRPGTTAIDVGANYGVYAYALARSGARVEAFEPLPACQRVLQAYRSPHIHVHGAALSSGTGDSILHVPVIGRRRDPGRASLREQDVPCETVRVPLKRLDDFDFRNVSLIKIDVEGHELDVLRGATGTIARERPALVIEVDQAFLTYPMTRVLDAVRDLGYTGYFLWGGRSHPIADVTHVPLGAQGVHNFVFVASELEPRVRISA